jgi:hypothetical protein
VTFGLSGQLLNELGAPLGQGEAQQLCVQGPRRPNYSSSIGGGLHAPLSRFTSLARTQNMSTSTSGLTSKNLVGTAGEYYVCAELCRYGYLALMTPKNNPLFDVVATSQDGTKSVAIQVKTRSVRNEQGWKLGADMASEDKSKGLFVVLVNLKESEPPDFYVYKRKELVKRVQTVYESYMAKPKKDGSQRKAVGFRWFDEISFTEDDKSRRNNWERIHEALTTG